MTDGIHLWRSGAGLVLALGLLAGGAAIASDDDPSQRERSGVVAETPPSTSRVREASTPPDPSVDAARTVGSRHGAPRVVIPGATRGARRHGVSEIPETPGE